MKTQNKTETLVFGIFFAIGLIFTLIGGLVYFSITGRTDVVEIEATISSIETYTDSDGDTGHRTFVTYEVDGQTYTENLNFYYNGYHEGDQITIYHSINNPRDIGTHDADPIALIFPGIGLLFALIGGAGFGYDIHKRHKVAKLLKIGQRIEADYSDTVLNENYAVNNEHPYRIICTWRNPANGDIRDFHSDNIWGDPSGAIESRGITKFPVYVDPANSRNYYVDLSILEDRPHSSSISGTTAVTAEPILK